MAKNEPKRQVAPPPPPWDETLVRRIGLAMKRARRGKSARLLSEDTARLGYRISPEIIAKIDSGHRGAVLNISELLLLAAALDIPPALLLFPGYPDSEVEYLPGRIAASKQAVDWFSGAGRMPTGADGEPARGNTGTDLVAAVVQYSEMSSKYLDLAALVHAGDVPEEFVEARREQLTADLAELSDRINELRSQLEGER